MLSDFIEKNGVSKVELCRRAKISRPYLYSILSGDVKPPTRDIQLRIADSLALDDRDRYRLFDSAALERDEIPADVVDYLRDSKNRSEIRKLMCERKGSE
ncbi:helix-turn-helix domain-containing protein [Enorma massiliensis]|uniref:helix-turn-helix domain-containing protein n=1 Tax=Enorma massiliensis TaxID=1472761 RepID=UPI003AEF8269